jgi:hypothetical protein
MTIHIYTPGPDDRPAETKEAESKLFAENLGLILDKAQVIIDTPRYFFCTFDSAFISVMFVHGGMIPLGVLSLLWQKGNLRAACRHCGGEVYIYGTGGSPLSGSHSAWGCCLACGKYNRVQVEHFSEIWAPLAEAIRDNPNEAVIEKGKRPKFSWSKGLEGETTPDKVIKAKVEAVTLAQLIKELKERG